MTSVEAKACGKIYIAGEYAVVVGKPAIIAPIEKYIRVKLTKSNKLRLKSSKYHNDFIDLDFNNIKEDNKYILATLRFFQTYLTELNINFEKIDIEILTELDNENNQKFGFGSSAAVVVALLRALSSYYDLDLSPLEIYKAGVMIQVKINNNTSFGDLACIAYEDVVYYTKFDSQVLDSLKEEAISKLLSMDWPSLVIERINFPHKFLIIHSKEQANSYSLVKEVMSYNKDQRFENFLIRSEELVEMIKEQNLPIFSLILALDELLSSLGKITHLDFMSENMRNIKKTVVKNNGVMKFSGSGCGDIIISFFNNEEDKRKAKIELEKDGFLSMEYSWKVRNLNE